MRLLLHTPEQTIPESTDFPNAPAGVEGPPHNRLPPWPPLRLPRPPCPTLPPTPYFTTSTLQYGHSFRPPAKRTTRSSLRRGRRVIKPYSYQNCELACSVSRGTRVPGMVHYFDNTFSHFEIPSRTPPPTPCSRKIPSLSSTVPTLSWVASPRRVGHSAARGSCPVACRRPRAPPRHCRARRPPPWPPPCSPE